MDSAGLLAGVLPLLGAPTFPPRFTGVTEPASLTQALPEAWLCLPMNGSREISFLGTCGEARGETLLQGEKDQKGEEKWGDAFCAGGVGIQRAQKRKGLMWKIACVFLVSFCV